MSTLITTATASPTATNLGRRLLRLAPAVPLALLEVPLALTTTLPGLRAARWLIADRSGPTSWFARLLRLALALYIASTITLVQLVASGILVTGIVLNVYFLLDPSA